MIYILYLSRLLGINSSFVFQPSGSSKQPKKKWGKNKKAEGRTIIIEIAEDGEPIAPANAKTKLVN